MCTTGVKLGLREVDNIDPVTGLPYHGYRNSIQANSNGVLTFADGRVEDINKFPVTKITQVMVDDPGNSSRWKIFENMYSTVDLAQLIKPGDIVAMTWNNSSPIDVLLFCNSR